VTGTLQVNGGNGGNGESLSDSTGGGGGGAGGSLWLYTTGDIILAAATSLQADGGTGGTGSASAGPTGGNGGTGARGRIRLDDADGSVVNAPGFAVVSSSSSSASTPLTTYDSEIAFGCGTIKDINNKPPRSGIPTILFILLLPLILIQNLRKFGRFR
jgi:hypothetical protein